VLACPHCAQRTISPLRKLFVGPAFSNRCPACGNRWALSSRAVAAAAGFVASYLAFTVLVRPARPLSLAVGLAVLALAAVVVVYLVPVVRR
jgi:hypothetical protein